MRKSVSIEMFFTEVPLVERIALAKETGFDAVEFAGWLDKDVDAIRRAAQQADIPIAAFTGDELYSPIDPARQEDYIELVRRSAETAKALGCHLLVTHSNALDPAGNVIDEYRELTPSKKLITLFDTYKTLAPVMEAAGVVLLVEAISDVEHPGVFMSHVDLAAEIVEAVDSPGVRLLCDIYHMQANGGRVCDSLRRYRHLIGHIHFADMPGRHEPGTGELNFAAIHRCIEEIGYDGYVGFALKPLTDSRQAASVIAGYH